MTKKAVLLNSLIPPLSFLILYTLFTICFAKIVGIEIINILEISVLLWTGTIVYFYTVEAQRSNDMLEKPILVVNADHEKPLTEFNLSNAGKGPALEINIRFKLEESILEFDIHNNTNKNWQNLLPGKHSDEIRANYLLKDGRKIWEPDFGKNESEHLIFFAFCNVLKDGNLKNTENATLEIQYKDIGGNTYITSYNIAPKNEEDSILLQEALKSEVGYHNYHDKFNCSFTFLSQKRA